MEVWTATTVQQVQVFGREEEGRGVPSTLLRNLRSRNVFILGNSLCPVVLAGVRYYLADDNTQWGYTWPVFALNEALRSICWVPDPTATPLLPVGCRKPGGVAPSITSSPFVGMEAKMPRTG